MNNITIHVYHEDGSAARSERKLVRTIFVNSSSSKRLTTKRAEQIIKKLFPEYKFWSVIKTDEGWQATRSIKPLEKCSYLFIWEKIVLIEDVS